MKRTISLASVVSDIGLVGDASRIFLVYSWGINYYSYNKQNNALIYVQHLSDLAYTNVKFSLDGSVLLAYSVSLTTFVIYSYNVSTHRYKTPVGFNLACIISIASMAADGTTAVIGCADGTLHIFQLVN